MIPSWVLILALMLVFLVILIKVIKKVVTAMFFFSLAVTLVLAVVGYFAYGDAVQLQDGLANQDSVFLFADGMKLYAGFRFNFSESSAEPYAFDTAEISAISSQLGSNEYSAILGKDFKLFIFNDESFPSIDSVNIFDEDFSKDFVIETIKSGDSMQLFSSEYARLKSLPDEQVNPAIAEKFGSDEKLSSNLFASLVSRMFEDDGTLLLVDGFKQGTIIIYPETILFKIIRMFPLSLSAWMVK